jgi:hypothetical protein
MLSRNGPRKEDFSTVAPDGQNAIMLAGKILSKNKKKKSRQSNNFYLK